MSEYIGDTFKHNGYTVKLIADNDAESPRDWYDNGLFIVTTRPWQALPTLLLSKSNSRSKNRYFEVLHDGQDARECMEDKELRKTHWVFPVFAYIHSGVALSLGRGGQFSDMWDSGHIGFVFAAKSEWRYQIRDTKKQGSARKAASTLVETWNQYLSGDVWGLSLIHI